MGAHSSNCSTMSQKWIHRAAICLVTSLMMAPPVVAVEKIHGGAPIATTPEQRLISIGGSLTEIVYALGKQNNLVAIDTSSVYPQEALKEKPNVGYMRALSAEGILALTPDLILAEEGAGPPETIDLLKQASIPFHSIPSQYTEQGIIDKITRIGEALNATEQAHSLASKVTQEMQIVARAVAELKGEKRRVLFLFSTQGGRLMVSGAETQADAIIKLAGGHNVIQSIKGFKPVSNEAVITADPEVILMMSRAGTPMTDPDAVFKHPGLAATTAAKNQALVIMPGQYLLGFGPRTAKAIAELSRSFYPNKNWPNTGPFTQKTDK